MKTFRVINPTFKATTKHLGIVTRHLPDFQVEAPTISEARGIVYRVVMAGRDCTLNFMEEPVLLEVVS